jgi:hypothetical protein
VAGIVSANLHTWIGEVRPGEQLAIGDGIVLRVEEKSGQRARLRLEFKKPTTIERIDPSAMEFARAGVSAD